MRINYYTSTRYINFDSSDIEVEVTIRPVLSRDEEVAFDWSDADLYKTVDTFFIEDPGSSPTSFPTEEAGVQHFLNNQSPVIKSAVETATGLSFDDGIHIREPGENWFVDRDIMNNVSSFSGQIGTLDSTITGGLAAINIALADHAADTGAHPHSHEIADTSGLQSILDDFETRISALE